ncbi:hypothetical protein NP233_g12860 [Leucocoprinus birnbaumii]|uniref:BTB domain-containing protein n=1 Tax=Leucocoprinus birnbaumii TaxID=56174 RepID=A0AAD5VFN9_9AGAR|nr:hypothetical protein NP233_g12860 [Leucocoprinus birnbaumii]
MLNDSKPAEEPAQCASQNTKDEDYYFEDGNIVHRSLFERNSAFFSTLFSLPQGDGTCEGSIEDSPIVCQDNAEDIQALCWLIYSSPGDICAQKNPDTIDIPKLISAGCVSHKYEFLTFRDWVLDVMDEFLATHPDKLIPKCGRWDRVRSILILTTTCKRENLSQRIQSDWIRRIALNESNAFTGALRAAEACEDLRNFHGRVYYAHMKATQNISAKNTEPIDIGDVGTYTEEAITKLTEQQRSRFCQGYRSLMSLRPRLTKPPALEDNPTCSVHARECISAWNSWWGRVNTDAWDRDAVEMMEEIKAKLKKDAASHSSLYGSYGRPPPCEDLIRVQAQQMVESFFNGLPDRFLIP